MKQLGISLLLLSSVIACGEKKDDESSDFGTTITPGSGPLSVAALAKPSDLGDLSRAEVIMAMESNRADFLATEVEAPEDEEPAEEEDEVDCTAALSTVEVVAEGDSMSVDINLDMTECLQKAWSEAGEGVTASVSKAVMSFYIRQTCVGGDLSSFNGRILDEVDDTPECDNNKILMNMTSEMVATISGNGQTMDINSSSVNVFGTSANEPCLMTKTADGYAQDGCVEIFKSVGPEGNSDNEYTKYTHNNLKWVASPNNTWYTSGQIAVEMNDWAGAVTFRGADINPAYTMEYGTEKINGTLTLPSGLYFKSSVQRAVKRSLPNLKKMR
jgi:hypothetical protein